MNTKADGKSYDICVYTSPEKIPFVRRLFRQILTKPLLLHLFSSCVYSRIFISFFNPTFQPINYITFVSFHFTVSVNIANTNFSHMTILDYVACFFIFSLYYIFPRYLACVARRLRERASACRRLL